MDRLTAMEVLVRLVETGSLSGAARLTTRSLVHQPLLISIPALAS